MCIFKFYTNHIKCDEKIKVNCMKYYKMIEKICKNQLIILIPVLDKL